MARPVPPASLLLYGAAWATLTACAALRPPAPVAVQLRDTAPVAMAPTGTGASWPSARWWRQFDDTTLNALIESAIDRAPEIASANAQIRAAQQNVRLASAASGLRIDANAQLVHQRLSDNGLLPTDLLGFNWYTQSDIGLSVRYQFDWWGKQRAALEAALDLSQARAAEHQTAKLGLAAAISSAYFNWQSCAARRVLVQESIGIIEQQLQLTERRAGAQLDTVDTALILRQNLAVQRENLALLRSQQQLQVIALAALLGTDATALPVLTVRPLPPTTTTLPDDVGTNLLARRPDIAASRWRVEAALRDTDAARASFYPDISLQALVGLSSIDLGRLLRSDSGVPSIGLAVDLPLFDAGLRHARHGAAKASLDLAITAYDEAVVNAAREAGAAAAAIEQAAQQRTQRQQQQQIAATQAAVALARVTGQLTHLGPQLEAQLREIQARDALLRVDLDALLADIQLMQALGGGPADTEDRK